MITDKNLTTIFYNQTRMKRQVWDSLDYGIVKARGGDVKVEAKDGVYYSVACLNRACRGVASNRYCNNGF